MAFPWYSAEGLLYALIITLTVDEVRQVRAIPTEILLPPV
jgi:hypothetical protein